MEEEVTERSSTTRAARRRWWGRPKWRRRPTRTRRRRTRGSWSSTWSRAGRLALAGDPGRDQGDGRVRGEPSRAAGPAVRGPDHRRAVESGRGAGAEVSERVVAFSTVGKAADAERIARALVERRLAACVNVLPGVVSVYRWKGEVCRDEELLLVIKTRAERLEALREALVALAPLRAAGAGRAADRVRPPAVPRPGSTKRVVGAAAPPDHTRLARSESGSRCIPWPAG